MNEPQLGELAIQFTNLHFAVQQPAGTGRACAHPAAIPHFAVSADEPQALVMLGQIGSDVCVIDDEYIAEHAVDQRAIGNSATHDFRSASHDARG